MDLNDQSEVELPMMMSCRALGQSPRTDLMKLEVAHQALSWKQLDEHWFEARMDRVMDLSQRRRFIRLSLTRRCSTMARLHRNLRRGDVDRHC